MDAEDKIIEIYRHMNGVFEQERDEGVSALQVALNEEKVMEKKLTSIQAEYSVRAATLEARITMLQDSLTKKKKLIATLERKKQDCGDVACDYNIQNTSTSTSTGLFEEDENLKFRLSYIAEVLQNIRAYRQVVYPNEMRNPSTPRDPSRRSIAIVVQGRPSFSR